jgi:hypothetical protein
MNEMILHHKIIQFVVELSYIMARTILFSMKRWWGGPLCTRPTRWVGFSLKQWSADRYVAPLWHIILIPSQPVFAFSLMLYAWRRSNKYQFYNLWFDPIEAQAHNLLYWGEHTNHYTTDAVPFRRTKWFPFHARAMESTKNLRIIFFKFIFELCIITEVNFLANKKFTSHYNI